MFETSHQVEEEGEQCKSLQTSISLSLPSVPYSDGPKGLSGNPLPSLPHETQLNVRLEESHISAGNAVNFIGRIEVYNTIPPLAPPVLTSIPPKPSTFVGREELLEIISRSLVKLQNVALIGMGGMGKTFIAQAILNNALISENFDKRRYFVRYDDIDASQMTRGSFCDRLASSIGLPSSEGNTLPLVNLKLASAEPTLLVLDNAETFLDSDHDGTIANCINEVGALSNVVLLITSRSTVLPTNLIWDRVQVPSLDATSASDLFRKLYRQEIGSDVLHRLLKSVDFHPLSINLLAQVAMQNGWLPEELIKSWERQQAALLHTGTAKAQSLAVTLTLSVKSPSLQKDADTIQQLLPVIAYLPQGINKSALEIMYPNLPQIHRITELLCKHSLTYFKDPFITMLAPIRLHFTRDFQDFSDMPMMKNVYHYYVRQLERESVDKEWFLAEVGNIEQLLANLLRKPAFRDLLPEIASTAGNYIFTLSGIHPRPTSLSSIITDLEFEPNQTLLGRLSYRRCRKRKALSKIKGNCILYLGILSHTLGSLDEARNHFIEASRILRRAQHNIPFRSLTFAVAVAHLPLGGFAKAQEALEADFNGFRWWWRSRAKFDLDVAAAAAVVLEAVRIARGQKKDARRLLKLGEAVREVQEKAFCGFCLTYTMMAARMLGQNEEASKLVEFTLDKKEKRGTRFEGSILTANFALYIGDKDRAQQYLLAEDFLSPGVDPDDSITFYQLLAVCKYLKGEVAEARSAAQNLTDHSRFSKHLMAATASAWINGWIELHEGNLPAASAYMGKAVALSEASANRVTETLARRALGEVACLEQDNTEAFAQFKHVADLCAAMGILDTYLFECGWAFWKLDARFVGWKVYSHQ